MIHTNFTINSEDISFENTKDASIYTVFQIFLMKYSIYNEFGMYIEDIKDFSLDFLSQYYQRFKEPGLFFCPNIDEDGGITAEFEINSTKYQSPTYLSINIFNNKTLELSVFTPQYMNDDKELLCESFKEKDISKFLDIFEDIYTRELHKHSLIYEKPKIK